MLISAAVRPRNLRRGVTDKKLGKLLGFEEAVGLTQVCGRIELSASEPREFFFLRELYHALTPTTGMKSARIVVEIDGKEVAQYSYKPEDQEVEKGPNTNQSEETRR